MYKYLIHRSLIHRRHLEKIMNYICFGKQDNVSCFSVGSLIVIEPLGKIESNVTAELNSEYVLYENLGELMMIEMIRD